MTPSPERTSGLLDTSVYIDIEQIDEGRLPKVSSLSAITLAELASGVHAADDVVVQLRRQQDLDRAQAQFDVLPFDVGAALAYGQVTAMVRTAGRNPRRRVADQLIASVAIANSLPLYTRNAKDFVGLERVLTVVTV